MRKSESEKQSRSGFQLLSDYSDILDYLYKSKKEEKKDKEKI
jgi:hypothetical protein